MLKAIGNWRESKTDDYTMDKEYLISHYSRGLIVSDRLLKEVTMAE